VQDLGVETVGPGWETNIAPWLVSLVAGTVGEGWSYGLTG
jgi:hypothetical protein